MNADMATIQPVSKELIYIKIADAIHSFIYSNQLKPGDKIPAERALAQQMQTSRNSVREALRILENQGLIQAEIGKGTFVKRNTPSHSIYFQLFKVNYLELLEVKTLLEREAIPMVMETATKEQLRILEQLLVELEEQSAGGSFATEQDKRFHFQLLSMCGNKTMAQMIGNLIEVLTNYAKVLQNVDQMWITTIPHHRQLVESIQAKDLEKALEAHQKIFEIDIYVLNSVASIAL